jgi:hypothetical protein
MMAEKRTFDIIISGDSASPTRRALPKDLGGNTPPAALLVTFGKVAAQSAV